MLFQNFEMYFRKDSNLSIRYEFKQSDDTWDLAKGAVLGNYSAVTIICNLMEFDCWWKDFRTSKNQNVLSFKAESFNRQMDL